MQFTITAVLAFAATAAFAAPLEGRQAGLCTSGNPVCCATDVLNLADLNCAPPTVTPTTVNSFISTCAASGQQAKCCLIPILGQALICSNVNPTA
ncbi:fungal hydrophobin [Pyrenophora seminiperda CCB06]|uniref:Fungal hydrophobin n=1 Tax=Pyrenophora seminiperda CCB06 TaxID=1302712 RepID=A0A3M7M526_9PLEO|nr:fungal hydrophobin [Pyrenophora seminiperda CCB06]